MWGSPSYLGLTFDSYPYTQYQLVSGHDVNPVLKRGSACSLTPLKKRTFSVQRVLGNGMCSYFPLVLKGIYHYCNMHFSCFPVDLSRWTFEFRSVLIAIHVLYQGNPSCGAGPSWLPLSFSLLWSCFGTCFGNELLEFVCKEIHAWVGVWWFTGGSFQTNRKRVLSAEEGPQFVNGWSSTCVHLFDIVGCSNPSHS